jgi:hypothetical protein
VRRFPFVSLKTGLSLDPIPKFCSDFPNLHKAVTGQRFLSGIENKRTESPGGPFTFADFTRIFAVSELSSTSSQSKLKNLSNFMASLPRSSPNRKAPQKATTQHVQTDCPVNFQSNFSKPFLIFLRLSTVSGLISTRFFFLGVAKFDIPRTSTGPKSLPITSMFFARRPDSVLIFNPLSRQPQIRNFFSQASTFKNSTTSSESFRNLSHNLRAELYLFHVFRANEAATSAKQVRQYSASSENDLFLSIYLVNNNSTGFPANEAPYFCASLL